MVPGAAGAHLRMRTMVMASPKVHWSHWPHGMAHIFSTPTCHTEREDRTSLLQGVWWQASMHDRWHAVC